MEKFGYYATHGGFANYNNGFKGLKYRKTRKNEYIAQQGLAHNNGMISVNTESNATKSPDAIKVGELVNEIVIDNGTKSNEEMRLNATNAPELEFVGDAKSNVKMVIEPLKKPASGKKVGLRSDDSVKIVKFSA